MTKPSHPKKKSKKPQETQPIDEALIQPDQVAGMVPNELQLAQLVVAHLPHVQGYKTLPDQANGALHQVLEVLAAIRRWRISKHSPIEIAAPFVEDKFNQMSEGMDFLPIDAFVEILLFDRQVKHEKKIIGWQMFCEERSVTQDEAGWPKEVISNYADEFRAWFMKHESAVEKRISRKKSEI